jgi:hypothetical protein
MYCLADCVLLVFVCVLLSAKRSYTPFCHSTLNDVIVIVIVVGVAKYAKPVAKSLLGVAGILPFDSSRPDAAGATNAV